MPPRNPLLRFVASSLLLFTPIFAGAQEPDSRLCHVGFYRLEDGRGIDIGRGEAPKLRWRMDDGTSGELTAQDERAWSSTLGWTGRADSHRVTFESCESGGIMFDQARGHRVAFETQDVRFQSAGAALAGRLVMPSGKEKVPLVVLVHGSEQSSARDFYTLQRMFPGAGIGAFVYDKRGTGASGGTFTHNYPALAADAAEALRTARKLAGSRAGRVGFQGSSQGGWVAPLAATLTPVDFVIVGYGLAVSPIDEDIEAVRLDMSRHEFGAAETAKALEVAGAAHAVVMSNFQSGYDGLEAMRKKYAGEPWFKYVRGNVTNIIYSTPPEELSKQGPILFAGILPNYDAMPVLRKLDTQQLWILGAEDIDAPSGETLRRLRALTGDGRPIATVVYPHAEHGMYEFETSASDERLSTRQPASYLGLMYEYARSGRVPHHLTDAAIYR